MNEHPYIVISGWQDGISVGRLLSPVPHPAEIAGTPPIPIPTHDPRAAVVLMINYYRNQYRLHPVVIDDTLSDAAQSFADESARTGIVGHYSADGRSPFVRMGQAGYPFRTAGEVAAAGYPGYLTVTKAWMDSPGHRRIVLGPYADVGSGLAVASDGTPHWVVDFGTK